MNRHILLTCTALAMLSTHAHAALITGGVYDENVFRTNAVDTSATSDVGNQVSLTTFKALITTAFADGTGGVAHFDGATDTTGALAAPGDSFTITYGPAQSLSIDVVNGTPTLMNVGGPGSGRTTISGSADFPTGRALSKSGGSGATTTGDEDFIFAFSAADQITHIGATLLSRDDSAAVGNVLGTVLFSDNTTTAVTSFINDANGTDDTFWGFKAPTGLFITGLSFDILDGGRFTQLDDLGFITLPAAVAAVPEPATASLALMGLGGLMMRRRRDA